MKNILGIHKDLGKEILTLALPTIIENVFQTLVGFLDTLVIARLSLVAVTAVGLANSLLNVYLAVYLAIGVGGTALIARSLGAKQMDKAQVFARQTQDISLVAGFLFGFITFFFGRAILQMMGANQVVLEDAQVFLNWVGGLSILQASMTGLATILRASGDSLTPMKVGLLTNLANLIFDYFLVFGVGEWKGLGILGTALGTVLARLIGCCLLARRVQKTELALSWKMVSDFKDYKVLFDLILPATLERLVMRLGQVVYFSLIVGLGTTVYAAHTIAGSIEAFTYMPAHGLALAATILIGKALGKEEISKMKDIAFLSSAYGVLIMSGMGLFLFVASPSIAQVFTKESNALSMVVTALEIASFNQLGLAVSLIMAGALQGIGDTKTPLYSTFIGMWGLRIVGVYFLANLWGLGIRGIWLAILIDLILRAIFLSWKFIIQLKSLTVQRDFRQ